MDSSTGPNQLDLQGNIQLLGNEQPVGISSAQYNSSSSDVATTAAHQNSSAESTLEEPVVQTIMRDARMIAHKLKYVMLPKTSESDGKELRNWDLWGPLLLCLTLACTLSIASNNQAETVFAIIFVIIWIGSGIVTLNAKLLGGQISFFQSVCLLGYCVFPVNIASFIAMFLPDNNLCKLLKFTICVGSFIWATKASVPFMRSLVKEEKKDLAIYPVFIFYLFLSCFVLVA